MMPTDAPPAAEDASLLLRIRHGEQAALGQLFDLYGDRAFGLALRITGDRPSAEDVVQEAYLAMWRNAAQLDASRGRVSSLLMTIVYRRAIDAVRVRRGRGSTVELDAVIIIDDGPSVGDQVAASVHRDVVRRAVDALPDDQRTAIRLAYFEGLTHVEVARVMDSPPGTVKSRLRLGIEKLRASVGAELGAGASAGTSVSYSPRSE